MLPPGNNQNINSKQVTMKDIAEKAIQMEHELLARGIPEEEVHRALIAYFSQAQPPHATPWPGPITGLDLAGRINPYIAPDTTGVPLTNFRGLPENVEPYPTPNQSPYGIGTSEFVSMPSPIFSINYNPATGDDTNWTGLAASTNAQPPTLGVTGFNYEKAIPEWRYDIEDSQGGVPYGPAIAIPPSDGFPLHEIEDPEEKKRKSDWLKKLGPWLALIGGVAAAQHYLKQPKLQLMAKYEYHGHERPEICESFNGQVFDLLNTTNRPVPPSEGLGYTTQHPHCACTWKILKEYAEPKKINKTQKKHIQHVKRHIGQAAKDGTLHKVKKDGELSTKTTKKNPLTELCSGMNVTLPSLSLDLPKKNTRRALQEAISNLRSEFVWLGDDYINSAKKLAEDEGGKLYLIRAAGESITNHMAEGEPYRRKLSADELNSMTRTAIGKKMDINHQPEFETKATILDAEFDKKRKEMQMLVVELDPGINQAIDDGKITAVSINGGMPRSESIEPCDHNCADDSCELCLVPKGVVLGELDSIGTTWVVTDPAGLYWNGHFIPKAEAGIKFTKIETL